MEPDDREKMHILCQRLAVEEDRRKFSEFVNQLMELLNHQQARLETASKANN